MLFIYIIYTSLTLRVIQLLSPHTSPNFSDFSEHVLSFQKHIYKYIYIYIYFLFLMPIHWRSTTRLLMCQLFPELLSSLTKTCFFFVVCQIIINEWEFFFVSLRNLRVSPHYYISSARYIFCLRVTTVLCVFIVQQSLPGTMCFFFSLV